MYYIVDLDDTLLFSTHLNNDAYNYSLEKYGYARIKVKDRITRSTLKDISVNDLKRIIKEKQKYFTSAWLKFRVIMNNELLYKIKSNGREKCILWTKANKKRTKKILKQCGLKKYFKKVVYDQKFSFNESMQKLKKLMGEQKFVIYENNHVFFYEQKVQVVDIIKNKWFDVKGYLIQ